MPDSNTKRTPPDKRLAAVCGLFCPACTLYIGTQEEPERLVRTAELMGRPVEDCKCDGCRSDRRLWYCRTCTLAACASRKGIEFCGECKEYPCPDLQRFQAERDHPHRAELWEAQARIREAGYETWYQEAEKNYSCRECGALNSAYDLACRKCGNTPSNDFVARHRCLIEEAMAPRKKP